MQPPFWLNAAPRPIPVLPNSCMGGLHLAQRGEQRLRTFPFASSRSMYVVRHGPYEDHLLLCMYFLFGDQSLDCMTVRTHHCAKVCTLVLYVRSTP
jgi:hypothetical protein